MRAARDRGGVFPAIWRGPWTGTSFLWDGADARMTGSDSSMVAQDPGKPSPAEVREKRRPPRTASLDLLRGLFILLMTVGFAIPGGIFPDWMYHRQFPGGGDYVELSGLTWRDVTLGGFLFTLAAAIPLTMSARIRRGARRRDIVVVAFRRFFFLFAFALIIGHSATHFTGDYTWRGFLIAIIGYLLCVIVFTRRPSTWNPRFFTAVQITGWAGVVTLFALWPHLFGQAFSPGRRDDVIVVLAFAALAGITIWIATWERPQIRLALLALLAGLRIASREAGWVQQIWALAPAPWLFHWSFLDALLVVIPGTIVGDLVATWSQTDHDSEPEPGRAVWTRRRLWGIALLALTVEPVLVFGMYRRWVPGTVVVLLLLAIAAVVLTRRPALPGEHLVRGLLQWGFFWALLGAVLDPFEGGIAKVPGTMSYYFVMAGITICLLTAAITILDVIGAGHRWIIPITDVGQNPMAAYMLMPMFVLPLLQLVPWFGPNASTTVAAVVRIGLWLIITAGLIGFLTRRRLLWRT